MDQGDDISGVFDTLKGPQQRLILIRVPWKGDRQHSLSEESELHILDFVNFDESAVDEIRKSSAILETESTFETGVKLIGYWLHFHKFLIHLLWSITHDPLMQSAKNSDHMKLISLS